MKRRIPPSAVIAMLAAAVLLLGVYLTAQAERVGELEASVNAASEKALYESIELTSALEINLEKIAISFDTAKRQALLQRASRQADGAQDNLAMFGGGLRDQTGAIKLMNQAGDFCRTLSERLAGGGAVSDDDEITLDTLRVYVSALNDELQSLRSRLEAGETVFTEPVRVDPSPASDGGEIDETLAEYPVLLYDGPFSDGHGGALTLTGAEIDQKQAEEAAVAFIGGERVKSIAFSGMSGSPAECYEFDVETDDGTLSVSVTKKGGRVLYMLASRGVSEAVYSQAMCVDTAAAFLASRGHPDMQVNYWQQNDGLLTANFAPVENGVVLYPDLIKVEVSMQTGNVVGVEAVNYLTNHAPRALGAPLLTEAQARAAVGNALNIERARLCVIPLEVGEAFCYELSASVEDRRYLIYIDAMSGQEREILKVVQDEGGQLAI